MKRNHRMAVLLPIFLVACDHRQETRGGSDESAAENSTPVVETPEMPVQIEAKWTLEADAKGANLVLQSRTGSPIISFFCPSGDVRLRLNVPGFKAIGSEERLSFGSDGEVEALVADFRGDKQRGGVSAEGAIPHNLANLMAGHISASYGSQISGPHPTIPRDLAGAFTSACRDAAAGRAAHAETASPIEALSPCLVQDGKHLPVQSLRAVGTEPFWGARIEGRCITYSHPDDQQGTRVWTRFEATPQGGLWSGALGGRLFELRAHAEPGCSDGMSDKHYPMAVKLWVDGERRKGCAEPL